MQASSPLSVIASDPPTFTVTEAGRIAAEHYGLSADATPLVSERDQNFRLRTADGRQYVLKIANAAEDPKVTDFQVRAMRYIARQDVRELSVPEVLPTLDGRDLITLRAGGIEYGVRVVTYLVGQSLHSVPFTAPLCRNLGATLARLGRALNGFTHPGASQSLLWDMRQAPVLRDLLIHIDDRDLRALTAAGIDDFEQHALPKYPALRAQVVHNDMNPANVLVHPEQQERVAGIIDFGDMLYAPLAVDVAIAASYCRVLDGDPLTWIAEFIAGYHAVTPLQLAEIDLLYDLINTRLAATVAILHWRQAERGGEDDYLAASAVSESSAARYLARLRELPRAHVRDLLRRVCASVTEVRS